MAVNPYRTGGVVGGQAGQTNRALVVNIMDPLKAGRCQIRVVGHMDDEQAIPDDKLPWCQIRNGTNTPSLQTTTTTHGLLPGTMVTCEAMGEGGQDWMITGSLPNSRKDDQQAIHPATQGKGDTDNIHPDKDYHNKTFGYGDQLKNIVENNSTKKARKIRDTTGKKSKRTADPHDESRDKSTIPSYYGGRAGAKDPKGGTVGVFKFQGKDAQQFIKDTIQNKSAIIPNALSALQNLKKVQGNPTSIQSIGAGNFQAILSQLSSWFGSGGGGGDKQTQKQFDCNLLAQTPDNELTEEEIAQKLLCAIIQQAVDEEQQTS